MTQVKTLFITISIAALSGALINHFLFPLSALTNRLATTSAAPALCHNQTEYASAQTTAALQQTIAQLQLENNRLKDLLDEHSSKKDLLANQINQAPTAPDENQKQLQKQLQQLEMEKQLRNANDFSSRIMDAQKNNPNFSLNHALAQGFNNEPRDPQWADEQENTYRNLFSATTELAGFALRDSQCKSSQCELTVSISNLEQSDQLLEKINNTLAANNKHAVIVIAPDAQAGISKLYISEDIKSFEFN